MFLRGAIHEGTIPNAVVVRQDAVIREAGGLSYVYIVDDHNQAQRAVIKIGTEYNGYYVVATGLKVGDKVITTNLQKIRSGAPVQIVAAPAQGQNGAANEAGAAAATDATTGTGAADKA